MNEINVHVSFSIIKQFQYTKHILLFDLNVFCKPFQPAVFVFTHLYLKVVLFDVFYTTCSHAVALYSLLFGVIQGVVYKGLLFTHCDLDGEFSHWHSNYIFLFIFTWCILMRYHCIRLYTGILYAPLIVTLFVAAQPVGKKIII